MPIKRLPLPPVTVVTAPLEQYHYVAKPLRRVQGSPQETLMQMLRSVQSWLGKSRVNVARRQPYELGWQLRLLFNNLQINTVINVGADCGQYGFFVRHALGYRGRIVSFERALEKYRALEVTAAGDNEWVTFPHAVGSGSTAGYGRNGYNGNFHDAYGETLVDGIGSETTAAVEAVHTLDDHMAEAIGGIENPRVYLRMATRGRDRQILAGATELLEHIVALQSEIEVPELYDGVPDFSSAGHHFHELGFTPIGFFPVNRESNEWNMNFDCVAIRRI